MNLFITGATGFVGRALVAKMLMMDDYHIRIAVRRAISDFSDDLELFNFEGISPSTDWENALKEIDCVIHTAARVHIMTETSSNPLEEFRWVNTNGTLNLARQAAESGVKRFIYLSSIKVNGEVTLQGSPFTPDNIFVPTDPYALSKFEAEQGLLQIAKESQMEVVIIRPPLVYGPAVKANFLSMMKWLYKGVPLPLGAIHNKRSLVALDNLVDFIITCVDHTAAANQVFLVADGEDLSTTELLTRVSRAMDKRSWLLPINQKILGFFLRFIGKEILEQRLCGSLQVDISKSKKLLNWTPPVSVNEGLQKTVQYFTESELR